MQRKHRTWLQMVLVLSLLVGLLPLPMNTAFAASRITITSLFVTTGTSQLVDGKPKEDHLVPRVTRGTIDLLATIEGVSDSQIPNLFLEITNMNTNQRVEEKGIQAQKTSDYDLIFRNVPLTEGLNKVVVKLGTTSVIESAPGWVYYTATTNISDLKINGENFAENRFYPSNPEQSTMINISGQAPNASEVRAYLYGEPTPITGYYNLGEFFFLGDDFQKQSTTANLRLKPGDNLLTLLALNNTKTYQVERNLIYDNGGPFAFGATISWNEGSGASAVTRTEKLIMNPTVTDSSVTVNSRLKIDQDTYGGLQYRYVEVSAGGKHFGPYDLGGAAPAVRATNLQPSVIYEGFSAMEFSLQGTALTNVKLFLEIEEPAGTFKEVALADGAVFNNGDVKTFKLSGTGDQALQSAKSPYKLIAKNGTTVLGQFMVNVVKANITLPMVTDETDIDKTEIINVDESNVGTASQTVHFKAAVDKSKPLVVEITNIEGTSIAGTGSGNYNTDGTAATYNLPGFLTAGDYKFRVTYGGYPLTERAFTVAQRPAQAPVISSVISNQLLDVTSAGATYLFVNGNHFGTDKAMVSAELVPDDGSTAVKLNTYDVTNTHVVFNLPDQSGLDSTKTYKLIIDVNGRNNDASTAPQITAVASGHNGKTIASVYPQQLTTSQLNTSANALTVNGDGLDRSTGLLAVQVLKKDGSSAGMATMTSRTAKSATISLPSLPADTYILQFINTPPSGSVTVLAQYPLTIANPQPTSLSPNIRSVTDTSNELTLTGTGLGNDPTKLQLRFVSDSTGNTVDVKTATEIVGTTAAKFNAPAGLPEGTYTVTVLYENSAVGRTLQYTIASPPASLRENSTWSKPGEYRVYDFSAQMDLTSDRVQQLEFRFYNVPSDRVQTTNFTFYYENPNLPYIDRVEINNGGSSLRLSEGTYNEINEQPATLYIYTNKKANGLNYYLGSDTSTAPQKATVDTTYNSDSTRTLNRFIVTLNNLPNGLQDITFVPSTGTGGSTSGENLAGRKTFKFNISSTPYVIVNNLYNGMVIRDISELSCVDPLNQNRMTSCIQGRLINVPEADYEKVEVYINEDRFTMSNSGDIDDFLDDSNKNAFFFKFGPGTKRTLTGTSNGDLIEGKNTIKFIIYRNGQPITEASFEIFKFSTNAPSFGSVRPVESGDEIKFRTTNVQNGYATNEMAVQFTGQFSNASEITLTVRSVNPETGEAVVTYDRRFGGTFNLFEPSTNNPNFFSSINANTGQFLTRPITLATQGDTIFEFSITNSTNITVTETITITRAPLPYKFVRPSSSQLIRNAKGQSQANINSNFYEIELEAENADAVYIDDELAVAREVVDPYTGLRVKHYFHEVRDLKTGANRIDFTVVRGDEETEGEIVLYNVNTPIEGATYKTPIENRIRVFNNQLTLTFPKGTNLMRNDPSAVNQYITTNRQILFGIADPEDGRVDKYKHPAPYDGQIGNPNPLITSDARLLLSEPTGRFRAASPLYWIDAGTISANETDMNEALTGSGRLPYDSAVFYNRAKEDLVVPSQIGELTLTYDPVIRNEGWKYVTVYHYDIYEDHRGVTGWRWRNIGGVVDPDKNTITVPFERFGYYQVVYMYQSYDDVISHPWARDDLDILYSKGIMLNKTNQNFVPNDPISRGEFATLLVKLFDIPLQYTEQPTFSDVLRVNPLANGLYDYKYIETAARAGIVRGSGGNRFQPDASITRQDAAVMIARAANLKLTTDTNRVLSSLQKQFTDANGIDVYARSSVEAIVKKGYIQGKENIMLEGQKKATYRFDPTATFTRAEAAAVAIRVMKDLKKIPK